MDLSVQFQHGKEGFLRYLDVANLFHAFLAFLLLLEELALTADITAITLCQHVLAHLLYGLSGNYFGPNGSLYGDVELLARQKFLELLAHSAAKGLGVVEMRQCGERIDGFSVEQDVHLDELAGTVACLMIVEGCVALRDALELVVEVDDYLAQRHRILQFHTVSADIFLLQEFASLAQTERHDGADIVGRRDDRSMNIWFLDVVN